MGNAILVEPIDLPTITAEGSAAGTLPSYLNNDWMGVVHRGTAAVGVDAFRAFDLGTSPPSIDTLALLSCANAPSQMYVQAGPTFFSSSVYASGLIPLAAGATAPTSGRINALHIVATPTTARHWAFGIVASLATPFEAGRLVAGRRIATGRNFSFGASFGAQDLGGGSFSAQGVWLPRPGIIQRTIGLSWRYDTKQEAEEQLQPLFERIGNSKHILLVTDPDANALRQRRMYFGPTIGNLEMLWQTSNGFERRINLVSTI